MRHFHHALGLATFVLASLGTAQAHQVWLENNGGQAQLFFGEFNDNLRETSPGALDKFLATPTLAQQTTSGTQQLSGQRNATGFSYNAASQAQTLFASAAYPLIDRSKRNEPALLWVPAARWVATPAQAVAANAQALDLVPTGTPGQLMVSFNGMALPKTKVQIVAPSGWSREAQSDEQGRVNFALPWKGLYVAEVHHSHKQGGEAQGKSYGEASYVTTLSFSVEDGMPSPALPAAAKP
ncbi:TonB-dependent receptor [Comamonas testosteroni]|uniref:TonB-dependent receptor n=1 Tax=Comamonas testosteroni TaxID=285 RepID=UPI0006822D6D|nr:TonB-dependent receptor [Comamonas testosteroni]